MLNDAGPTTSQIGGQQMTGILRQVKLVNQKCLGSKVSSNNRLNCPENYGGSRTSETD